MKKEKVAKTKHFLLSTLWLHPPPPRTNKANICKSLSLPLREKKVKNISYNRCAAWLGDGERSGANSNDKKVAWSSLLFLISMIDPQIWPLVCQMANHVLLSQTFEYWKALTADSWLFLGASCPAFTSWILSWRTGSQFSCSPTGLSRGTVDCTSFW